MQIERMNAKRAMVRLHMKADVKPAMRGPRNQPMVHNKQPRKASCCCNQKKLKMFYSNQLQKARIWLIIDSLSNFTSISNWMSTEKKKKLHLKLIMDFFTFIEATQDLCTPTESWTDTPKFLVLSPHSSACHWQIMVGDSSIVEAPNKYTLLVIS